MSQNEVVDLSTKEDVGTIPTPTEIPFNPDKERLHLAKLTLFWLAMIFILSMGCQICGLNSSEKIFEVTSHGVPPIVTLILGYYFSKS